MLNYMCIIVLIVQVTKWTFILCSTYLINLVDMLYLYKRIVWIECVPYSVQCPILLVHDPYPWSHAEPVPEPEHSGVDYKGEAKKKNEKKKKKQPDSVLKTVTTSKEKVMDNDNNNSLIIILESTHGPTFVRFDRHLCHPLVISATLHT